MSATRTYSASSLARAAGCSRKAVRVYEARGLIARKPGGGPPSYDDATFQEVKLILVLRRAGLSLDEIRDLQKKRDAEPGGPDSARALADAISDRIRAVSDEVRRLTAVRQELVQVRETLAHCATCAEPAAVCSQCADAGKIDAVTRALIVKRAPANGVDHAVE